jgi:hypothetical protein
VGGFKPPLLQWRLESATPCGVAAEVFDDVVLALGGVLAHVEG